MCLPDNHEIKYSIDHLHILSLKKCPTEFTFMWNSPSLVKLKIKTDLPCTDLLPLFQVD